MEMEADKFRGKKEAGFGVKKIGHLGKRDIVDTSSHALGADGANVTKQKEGTTIRRGHLGHMQRYLMFRWL